MGEQDPKEEARTRRAGERAGERTGEPAGEWAGEWAREWIQQQRELLRQRAAAAPPDTSGEIRSIADKWLELGQSWIAGAADCAAQGMPSFAGFKVGEEFLDAWKNAWTSADLAQQSASRAVSDMLGRLPPVGLAREHTEAWRELAAAQAECQQLEQELRGMLLGVQREALALLEARVRERAEPLNSYRDLYNLWVECAEQVFARVAHSEPYGKLQAELGNASMRLRARQQRIIEYMLRQLDLPTRSELNSVHLQLRALRKQMAALAPGTAGRAKKASRAKSARRRAKGRPG